MINRDAIAWSAGIFEGEGCVRIVGKRMRTPLLAVAMTDGDVVLRLCRELGMGRVHGPYNRGAGRKDVWHWTVTSFEKTQALIAMWWPWLGSRRRQRAIEVLREAQACPVPPRQRMACPKGHPYSTENTYYITRTKTGKTSRFCRTCNLELQRRWRAGLKSGAVA